MISITVDGPTTLTVLLSRTCLEVTCPAPGGDPALSTCRGGRCVSPRCSPDLPDFCSERAALGDPCALDAECATPGAVCVPAESLTLSGSGFICTLPCCEPADCPGGTVCWTPRNGARGCVPPEAIALAP